MHNWLSPKNFLYNFLFVCLLKTFGITCFKFHMKSTPLQALHLFLDKSHIIQLDETFPRYRADLSV